MSVHYEPISHIDENYLNSCSPAELIQGVHDSYRVDYEGMPFAQKDFHMARQFFVRRICKYGFVATGAFEMIYQVTKKLTQ